MASQPSVAQLILVIHPLPSYHFILSSSSSPSSIYTSHSQHTACGLRVWLWLRLWLLLVEESEGERHGRPVSEWWRQKRRHRFTDVFVRRRGVVDWPEGQRLALLHLTIRPVFNSLFSGIHYSCWYIARLHRPPVIACAWLVKKMPRSFLYSVLAQ
jgi:hypothetical protein